MNGYIITSVNNSQFVLVLMIILKDNVHICFSFTNIGIKKEARYLLALLPEREGPSSDDQDDVLEEG